MPGLLELVAPQGMQGTANHAQRMFSGMRLNVLLRQRWEYCWSGRIDRMCQAGPDRHQTLLLYRYIPAR